MAVKLADLHPAWGGRDPLRDGDAVGVWFDCPGKCCEGKERATSLVPNENQKERIWVPFENPPAPHVRAVLAGKGWDRTGNSFDALTLSPSVDFRHGPNGSKGWHGFVRNGEIVDA